MNIIDQSLGQSQSTHKLPMAALFKPKQSVTRNEKGSFLLNNGSLSVLVPQNMTTNYSAVGAVSPMMLRQDHPLMQTTADLKGTTAHYLQKHSTLLQQTMKAANAS